jgi:hypothetical protein
MKVRALAFSRRWTPVFVALALLPHSLVHAATLTVLNLADSGPGSLRQAIADAAPGDTISFATNVTGTITLTSGELRVGKSLMISGPGSRVLTVSGNNASRVFNLTNNSATVGINGLTIANGVVLGANGTNAASGSGGVGATAHAAGLWNLGTLALTNCALRDHTGVGGVGGSDLGSATAARFSSMKSANCRSTFRRSCCVCCRRVSSNRWAAPARAR